MFKKYRRPHITTLIGRDVEILGEIRFSGGLHVDGSIKGDVTGESEGRSTLILSDSGIIVGDIRVVDGVLNGTITGDVYVSGRVELAPAVKLTGTLYYRFLEMAMGAEVNGQLVHIEDMDQQQLTRARLATEDPKEAGAEDA